MCKRSDDECLRRLGGELGRGGEEGWCISG